jgi:hypothetical protein
MVKVDRAGSWAWMGRVRAGLGPGWAGPGPDTCQRVVQPRRVLDSNWVPVNVGAAHGELVPDSP